MPDASGALASIPERQNNRVIGQAGLNPNGPFDRPSPQLNLYARHNALAAQVILCSQAKFLQRSGTDQDHVFPGNLRDWVGQFLEPAVVIPTAIVKAMVALK